jgi:transcriptional regulator with GAF, ATPase, and Fis domain
LKHDHDTTEMVRFALRTEATSRHLVQLRWTDTAGAHLKTVDGRLTLGSASRVDISVADPLVSRLHAELSFESDGLWVRDLGSRNGTYVQGVRVREACVPPKGEIRVGSTRISTEPTTSEIELWPEARFGPLIGGSEKMREFFVSLARVAPTDASVLVLGETGCGKELVARAVHEASSRAEKPLVVVDCAALPENLIESELFGHAKGAFTGAVSAHEGAFEAADGGTLFLDEIGELPLSVQPKLLRVLETKTVRRIGETSYRPVDVRILSATHRDLRTFVNAKSFREDLYFRIAVLPVIVPPLRERTEDIELLVKHFLRSDAPLSPELVRELAGRPWRGNVRELRNFVERARALGVERALAMASGDAAEGATVPPQAAAATQPPPQAPSTQEAALTVPGIRFEQPYRSFRERWADVGEREYLLRLLARHARNVSAAAQEAQLDRTHVYRLMRKHVLSE